jgi:hypothetical protein
MAFLPDYNPHLVDFRLSRLRGTPLGCRRIHSLLSFTGEIYDSCPECLSPMTEELKDGIDVGTEFGEKPHMKCLSCGHRFSGEVYDGCPECFSANTLEIHDAEGFEALGPMGKGNAVKKPIFSEVT